MSWSLSPYVLPYLLSALVALGTAAILRPRRHLPGGLPLLLLMYARRSLKETQRFAERAAQGPVDPPLFELLRGPHRRRVLQMAAIWFLSYLCTSNAVLFWKEFALAERGLTQEQTAQVITVAARGIRNPLFENLEIVVSTWGAIDFADHRWDSGTDGLREWKERAGFRPTQVEWAP